MTESKTNVLLLMLMGIVILLMVAIIGLFIRMNQLQQMMMAVLASPQMGQVPQDMGLVIGTQAPTFTLSDVNGVPISLRDFMGRQVLLVFSSTSCPACTRLYPHLGAFSQDQENVQVVMISQSLS